MRRSRLERSTQEGMPLGHLLLAAARLQTRCAVDRQVTLLRFRLLTIFDVSVKHTAR
jgi:hypothetical protein